MARRGSATLIGMAALALLLTGCTASESAEEAVDPLDSPLNRYMSAIYGGGGDEEEMQREAVENQRQVEELVAQCMAEEGFEYIPQTDTMSFDVGTEWEPESEEFVAQYGYGAVRFPGWDQQPDPEDMPEDPNQDYVMSLSPSEQTAFYETLYGPSPTEEEMASGDYMPTWEQQGCYGRAQHEITGEDPLQAPEHKPLMDALQAFYTDVATADELSELDAAWAACMTEAGYSGFTHQADAQQSVWDKMNEYYESQTEYIENDPALDALFEEEVELALADLDCREQTNYRAEAQKITWALEEQFIADHRTELDALMADVEARP